MSVLNWEHRCHEIPRKGLRRDVDIDPDTRTALAASLHVLGFDRVAVHYEIEPLRAERFRVKGRAQANVRLECGVSLDPVIQVIDETFSVEYWPTADAQPDDLGFDPLGDLDVEPIEKGRIDAGRLITEIIASAIDPFARENDATLEATTAEPVENPASHPFAALATLKQRTGPDSEE